jgi:hypothetical protein
MFIQKVIHIIQNYHPTNHIISIQRVIHIIQNYHPINHIHI